MSAGLPQPKEIKVSQVVFDKLNQWLSTTNDNPALWFTSTNDKQSSMLARYLYYQWTPIATIISWGSSSQVSGRSDLLQACQALAADLRAHGEKPFQTSVYLDHKSAFETTITQLEEAFNASNRHVVGLFPFIDNIRATETEVTQFLTLLQKWQATERVRLFFITNPPRDDLWTRQLRSIWKNSSLHAGSYSIKHLRFPKTLELIDSLRKESDVPINALTSKRSEDIDERRGQLLKRTSRPAKTTVEWFNKYMKTADLVELQKRTRQYNRENTRVKVAILDSTRGEDAGKDGREECSDVEQFDHGNNVVRILQLVAPDVDVYIATISNGDAHGVDCRAVSRAIRWAVEQKVDIISMSFGYKDSNDDVEQAIGDAHHKKILMFAATSNDGQNGDCLYPARQLEVIDISSATAMGSSSDSNPPSTEDRCRFTCLGEDIALEAMEKDDISLIERGRISGSSFATAFAVGIAAMVLGFVAQHENRTGQGILFTKLHDTSRMRRVLEKMSERQNDGSHYLTPWKFFTIDLGLSFESQSEFWYHEIKTLIR